MTERPIYRRILLKLSGEALMGRSQFGIDPQVLDRIALEITEVMRLNVQVGIVVGGGNLFREAPCTRLVLAELLAITWACLQP